MSASISHLLNIVEWMQSLSLSLSHTHTHRGNMEKANNLIMKYVTVNAKIKRLTKELHPQPSCY